MKSVGLALNFRQAVEEIDDLDFDADESERTFRERLLEITKSSDSMEVVDQDNENSRRMRDAITPLNVNDVPVGNPGSDDDEFILCVIAKLAGPCFSSAFLPMHYCRIGVLLDRSTDCSFYAARPPTFLRLNL